MGRREDFFKILEEQVFIRFGVHSFIYHITDSSFKYEKTDANGKLQIYFVEYTIGTGGLNIKFNEEILVGPPSFRPPHGYANISMDGS
jgi:hypothetical protein